MVSSIGQPWGKIEGDDGSFTDSLEKGDVNEGELIVSFLWCH